jgi:hypothetical protein
VCQIASRDIRQLKEPNDQCNWFVRIRIGCFPPGKLDDDAKLSGDNRLLRARIPKLFWMNFVQRLSSGSADSFVPGQHLPEQAVINLIDIWHFTY